MQIEIYQRADCAQAKGLCVVIDVLRAFTTAAYAFAAGAKEIILVSSVAEALQMHHQEPELLLMGEEGGRPIQGFHYGNSPAEIKDADLKGRRMVQRTSAGTQGVIACSHTSQIMLASFVVAEATLKRILELAPVQVSFIVTGTRDGDEDRALAEYLQQRLLKRTVALSSFLDRVKASPEGQELADPLIPEFPIQDLQLALQADHFDFCMEVEKRRGQLIAHKTAVL